MCYENILLITGNCWTVPHRRLSAEDSLLLDLLAWWYLQTNCFYFLKLNAINTTVIFCDFFAPGISLQNSFWVCYFSLLCHQTPVSLTNCMEIQNTWERPEDSSIWHSGKKKSGKSYTRGFEKSDISHYTCRSSVDLKKLTPIWHYVDKVLYFFVFKRKMLLHKDL